TMKATELRPGMGVKLDGNLYVITQYDHRTPGNLRAFIQVKLRDVVSGKHIEKRLASGDDLEGVNLDRREMEYLFSDNTGATFMDLETYDQIVIPADVLGDAMLYLAPNSTITVLMYSGNPVTVE